MEKLYWISDLKTGSGLGSWKSHEDAKMAIKKMAKLNNEEKKMAFKRWKIVGYNAIPCPVCHELAEEETVDSLGCCLKCDKYAFYGEKEPALERHED